MIGCLCPNMQFAYPPTSRNSASASQSEPDDSDDDTTSASDSASSDFASGPAVVDLTLERLQSLQSFDTSSHNVSSYAQTGSSKQRIVDALRNPCCPCNCKVPSGVVLKIATAFWELNKLAQDSLLWSIQREAGDKSRKQWHIQGLFT